MSHPKIIAKLKAELGDKSNDELEILKAEGDGSPSPDAFNRRIAATLILNERMLSEMKKPHWSVSPSFVLLVLSVSLSAAALFVAVTQQPQAQSPAAVVAPPTQIVQPAPERSSNSHTLSAPTLPQPPKSAKN